METVAKPDAIPDRSDQAVETVDIGALLTQHGALLALAHTITRNWSEAEDLYQSTFEIALRHADQLRDQAAARAWLRIGQICDHGPVLPEQGGVSVWADRTIAEGSAIGRKTLGLSNTQPTQRQSGRRVRVASKPMT